MFDTDDSEKLSVEERRFKLSLQNLDKRMLDLEMAISEVGGRVQMLERHKEMEPVELPPKLAEELEDQRVDLGMMDDKLESIGKVVDRLVEEMGTLEKVMTELDGLTKFGDLRTEMEGRTKSLDVVAKEVEGLSGRMQAMYEELNSRIPKKGGLDSKSDQKMNGMQREIDWLKQGIDSLQMQEKAKETLQDQQAHQTQAAVRREIETVLDHYHTIIEGRFSQLAKRIDLVSGILNDAKAASSAAKQVESLKRELEDLKVVFTRFADDAERKEKKEDKEKEGSRGRGQVQILGGQEPGELALHLSRLEQEMSSLRSMAGQLSQSVRTDERELRGGTLQALVDHVVYIESRMSAIEKNLSQKQSIILE